MGQPRGVYVEILIRGDIDEVWKHTQRPELHEPWDLRFTKIRYLPRESESEPQRFTYTTRVGFGLQIAGEGESTGNREEATGRRTSALRFWSADPKSLIEEGSGYWQYVPAESGARFLTSVRTSIWPSIYSASPPTAASDCAQARNASTRARLPSVFPCFFRNRGRVRVV
jgi:hypothetical protein